MVTKYLKEIFGYQDFRDNQADIIKNVIEKKNSLAIMPTGSGKSLCYQLPGITQKGMAIVVSPLIALMKNQVDFLQSKRVEAVFLNSTLSKKKVEEIRQSITDQKLKLLYIAPETLNKNETIEFLKTAHLSFIAIDEAHCISEWGYDFRPEYGKLKNTIQELGNLPVIALTATATPRVQDDILKKLNIQDATIFKASFSRPNLYYEIRPKQNIDKQVINFVKEHSYDPGIIYCHSRKKVEEIAKLLQVNGVESAPYHAGLDNKTRIKSQDGFLSKEIRVIVATIAFGMGIDKPDVRFVIHYDAPKSMENYYQETGRAGRDGKKSTCILFYDPKDLAKLEKLNTNKNVSERENANLLLAEVRDFARSSVCIRKQILSYFGERLDKECGKCGNCLHPTSTYEGKAFLIKILEAIQQTKNKLSLTHLSKFICGIQDSYIENNEFNILSGFGSGKEKLPPFWRSAIRQTMYFGYIKRETAGGVFFITSKGEDFLKNPYALSFYKEKNYDMLTGESPQEARSVDAELFEQLLQLRKKEAERRGIKPYLIFQEHILENMAMYYPTTINALAFLPNVSLSKANKFGNPFITLISQYVLEHDIKPVEAMVVKPSSAKFANRIQLIKQIDKKIDLEDLAEMRTLSYIELIKELEEICHAGVRLNLDYYIDTIITKEEQEDIYEYLYELESYNIERACDELGDEYDEDEVRLMYIKFLSEVAN